MRYSKPTEYQELSLKVLKITYKAVLVTEGVLDAFNKEISIWLPLSQIKYDNLEEDKICNIDVPEWLIKKNNLG